VTNQQRAQQEAQERARQAEIYVPKNGVELKNYNERLRFADNPASILWCTSAFEVPGSPLFTVPVVGKLTSGDKRPYNTTRQWIGPPNVSQWVTNEVPGPDGMYGHSVEYRYGRTPAGILVDFTNMEMFCTSEPTVWQKEATAIVNAVDQPLADAQRQAQEMLARGDEAGAAQVLGAALGGR
jgi:hypothetical protein